jgi:hypothetical protein
MHIVAARSSIQSIFAHRKNENNRPERREKGAKKLTNGFWGRQVTRRNNDKIISFCSFKHQREFDKRVYQYKNKMFVYKNRYYNFFAISIVKSLMTSLCVHNHRFSAAQIKFNNLDVTGLRFSKEILQ